MEVRCPHCHTPVDLASDSPLSDIACPSCGSSFSLLGGDETVAYEGATKTIGHFQLIEQVGAGAFAIVWKARDTELDRTVAVKIPRKGQLDATETEQFLREARAAAQLKHQNIVNVHEVGRDDDTVYIVSDYVEGLTLEALLEVHEQEQTFLKSPPEAGPTEDRPAISEGPGCQIGRYKLLQRIGEGEFGVVYMAEQQRPVRRKVALKIIKPGMDTKSVVVD